MAGGAPGLLRGPVGGVADLGRHPVQRVAPLPRPQLQHQHHHLLLEGRTIALISVSLCLLSIYFTYPLTNTLFLNTWHTTCFLIWS